MKLDKYSSVEDFIKILRELSPAVREEIFNSFCKVCGDPLYENQSRCDDCIFSENDE